MNYDLEASLLVLYSDTEQMAKLLDEGLNEELLLTDSGKLAFRLAREHYIKSGRKSAIARRDLESDPKLEQHIKRKQEAMDAFAEEPLPPFRVVRELRSNHLQNRGAEIVFDHNSAFAPGQEFEDSQKQLKLMISKLMRLSIDTNPDGGIVPMSDDMEDFVLQTEEKYQAFLRGEMLGITFGHRLIDTSYLGMRSDELAIIAAAYGVGKSWWLCKQAYVAARDQGKTAIIFTMENSKEMTYARIAAIAGHLSADAVETGRFAPIQKKQFEELVGEEVFSRIYVKKPKTRQGRTMEEMYYQAQVVGADILLGDQLSWVEYPSAKNMSDWEKMGEVVHLAKELCTEYNIPATWAAQMNRKAAQKSSVGIEEIGRAIRIAQEADWAFVLQPDQNQTRRTLLCDKHRRGEKKRWGVTFDFTPTRIEVDRELPLLTT